MRNTHAYIDNTISSFVNSFDDVDDDDITKAKVRITFYRGERVKKKKKKYENEKNNNVILISSC